jgi:hypothetical protein
MALGPERPKCITFYGFNMRAFAPGVGSLVLIGNRSNSLPNCNPLITLPNEGPLNWNYG